MLEKGSVVNNRYEVLTLLGEGGMGTVYKVKDYVENRIVALKMIKEKILSEKANQRFKNEFKLTLELDHPNIVKVFNLDIYKPTDTYFFTMEYIHGESLNDAFIEMSENHKLNLLLQISRGLNYIHSRHIIHFDIKPDNIFIIKKDNSYQAKIMDFGLASLIEEFGGKVRGTMSYIAPEVLLKKDVDYRCDLYSLGMVIYHIFSGKLPFEEFTSVKSIAQAKSEESFFHEEAFNRIDKYLIRNLIADLCRARKEHRIQSARQLINLIETVMESNIKNDDRFDDNLNNIIFDKNDTLAHLKKEYLNFLLRGDKKSGKLTSIVSEKGNGKSQILKKFNLQAQMNRIQSIFFRIDKENSEVNLVFRKLIFGLYAYVEEDVKNDRFFSRLTGLVDQNGKFIHTADLTLNLKSVMKDIFESLDLRYAPVVILDDLNNLSDTDFQILIYMLHLSVTAPIFLVLSVNDSLKMQELLREFENIFCLYPPDMLYIQNLNSSDLKKYVSLLLSTDADNLDPLLLSLLQKESSGNKFLLKSYLSFLIEKNILVKKDNYYRYNHNFIHNYQAKIDDIYTERIKNLTKSEKFVLLFIMERYNLGESFRNMDAVLGIDDIETTVDHLIKSNLIDFEIDRGGRNYYIKNDSLANLIKIILLDENLKEFYDRLSEYYRKTKISISKYTYFFIRSSADAQSKENVLNAGIEHCRISGRFHLLRDFLVFRYFNFDLDYEQKKSLLKELYKLLVHLYEVEDGFSFYNEYLTILTYQDDSLEYADALFDSSKFRETKIKLSDKVSNIEKAGKIYLSNNKEKFYFSCIQKICSLYFRAGEPEKGFKFLVKEYEQRSKVISSKAVESMKSLLWLLKPSAKFKFLQIYNNIVAIYNNLEIEYLNQEENIEILHITLVNLISFKNIDHALKLAELYLNKVDKNKIEGLIIDYIRAWLLLSKGEIEPALDIYRRCEQNFEMRKGNKTLLLILVDILNVSISKRISGSIINNLLDKVLSISKYVTDIYSLLNIYLSSIEYNIAKADWIEVEIQIRYFLAMMGKKCMASQLSRFLGLTAMYYYLIKDQEGMLNIINRVSVQHNYEVAIFDADLSLLEYIFDFSKLKRSFDELISECYSAEVAYLAVIKYVSTTWKNLKKIDQKIYEAIIKIKYRFNSSPVSIDFFNVVEKLILEDYKEALKITAKLGKENYSNGYVFDCYFHILVSLFFFKSNSLYKNALFFEDKFEKLTKRISNKLGDEKKDRLSLNHWIY
ncbi:MAG: serine/threonine protein kinase [Candidatus Delongbacteria bacterium]|nr:serine/threonine protein kinase [Candidatus Delongbacteria bacterium]MBN2836131.1 serine/threonine protein kinase [Candidatus Delongbacteria bacterium]